jgi:hypothetical protein
MEFPQSQHNTSGKLPLLVFKLFNKLNKPSSHSNRSNNTDLFFILTPCISDYVEINQPNALKLYISLFFLTMAPTCFGKTMPSSGSDSFPV